MTTIAQQEDTTTQPEVSSEVAASNAANDAAAGGARIAQIAACIARNAKTKAEGQELAKKFQLDANAVSKQLGLPDFWLPSEFDEAMKRCDAIWQKHIEQNIEYVVHLVQDKSLSTMDADKRFRHLQQKIGSNLPKGVLTQEVLNEAQQRCHSYWSRVTPGNVALIVEKMAGKCPDMETAKKKFDWLWREGSWREGRRYVTVGGREYTAEDLEQAERRCRVKFGLSAAGGVARLNSEGQTAPEVTGQKAPAVKADAETATPTATEGASTPADAAEVKPAAHRPLINNVDFIVNNILQKCNSMETAKKFFEWMRRADKSKEIKGRMITAADVDEAEKRCKETWEKSGKQKKADEAAEEQDSGSSSDSSSSSKASKKSTEESKPTQVAAKKPAAAGIEELVAYVMKKYDNAADAERYFNKLFSNVGRKIAAVGRGYSQEELTAAWFTCGSQYEEREAAKSAPKKRGRPAAEKPGRPHKQETSNADFIVRKVLRKCADKGKVDRVFNMLHQGVDKPNQFGRTFSLQDVTEAYVRVLEVLEKQKEEAADASGSEGSSSSSSSSSRAQRRRGKDGKKSKGKKDRLARKRSGLGGDELEGALFGSDSDLSGEEEVDQEEEGKLSADILADLGAIDEEDAQLVEDNYQVSLWEELAAEVLPGFEGFNSRATAVMCKAGVGQGRLQVTFDENAACPPLQPHQEAVGFLMHPKSPVKRLLVDHPTGSGKTREMIRVLDNYFFDPRPKIPIFPKDPVCRNFYFELLRWPNRYRDYFCCERPADAAIASGKPDWKEFRYHMWDLSGFPEEEVRRLGYSIREVLEMKGMFYMGRVRRSLRVSFRKKHPGEAMPAAPLRALGYTSAGGSFASLTSTGNPASSLMKIGFAKGSGNVYGNKVVLMDEAHNLVRSQTQYADQLQRLRRLLFEAKNLVLAGFTGTPILSEPSEGRQLLDIIKGILAPEGDEGFLSSFPMRPQPLFPLSLPRGLPDGVLTLARRKQLVKKVEIRGEALKVYDIKRRLGLPGRRLRAYCNVCTFHASFHEGRHGTKTKILAQPEDCCPKLLAIAEAVLASSEKAVIMTGRTSGYIVMLELMKHLASKAEPSFEVATMNELSEFNHSSNLRGEKYRVLVADALQCSEGVSFLAVRRTYLADVPVSPSAFIQQCGRSIRMYGHRGLPENEQIVTTQLYVATLPKWMRASSLACWALRAQKKHASGKEVEKRARVLTARLNRAGINTLEDLKARIDAHGEAKLRSLGKESGKEGLTAEDVLTFLEQNGLWEEARLLRNADKKDKEREKAEAEKKNADTQEDRPSLTRADTTASSIFETQGLERTTTMEEDDFTAALENLLDEEVLAAQGDAPQEAAPMEEEVEEDDATARAREMDDEARLAAEDELDGDEVMGPPRKTVSFAPTATNNSSTAGLTDVPSFSPVEASALLGEALTTLRAACRDADRKVPSASTAPNGSSTQASIPMEPTPEQVKDVTMEAVPSAADQSADQSKPVDYIVASQATVPVPPGEDSWRKQLEEGLGNVKDSGPFITAVRSALPEIESPTIDFKTVTIQQIRALRDEVARHEKVASVKMALDLIKEVRTMINEAETAAAAAAAVPALASVATVAPVPAPVSVNTAPESTPEPVDTQTDQAPVQETSTDAIKQADPAPELSTCAAATESAPDQPAAAEASDHTTSVKLQQDLELAWRRKLAAAFRVLKRMDHVKGAFEVAAPGLLEKILHAEQKKLEEEKGAVVQDNDEEEEACLFSSGLTPEHVRKLHDELARLLEQAEKGATKPRALVRAMQMLYLAETAADAAASLRPETADEEALRQLTERSEEFAIALSAMRSLAVDKEVFAHLADELEHDHQDMQESESEASDVGKELAKNEPAPVVLPAGWRLEWVKRKKKEMREFVDPDGRRYRNVREVREGLLLWESMQAAKAAAARAAEAAAAAGTLPPAKRTRLRGKSNSFAFDMATTAGTTGLTITAAEDAFAEDLLAALGVSEAPSTASEAPKAESGKSSSSTSEPRVGAQIRLCNLVAKPELNGKLGSLRMFNSTTERWECILEDGGKVNVKTNNFAVLPAEADLDVGISGQVEKRPLDEAEAPRRVRARGRGRGGRGRGASKQTLDEEEE